MNIDRFLEQYGFSRKENSDYFVKGYCRLQVDDNQVFITDDENYELGTVIDENNYEEKLHELFEKANDILFEKLKNTLDRLLTMDQTTGKAKLLEKLRQSSNL